MFVKPTDFTLQPYIIPNADRVLDNLQAVIDREEKKLLRGLLGLEFYNALVDAVEALPDEWNEETTYATNDEITLDFVVYKSLTDDNVGHSPDEEGSTYWEVVVDGLADEWADLILGVDYEVNDVPYEWAGLIDMLVPYVYAQWLKYTKDADAGVGGVVQSDVENGTIVSARTKFNDAWNDTAKKSGGVEMNVEDSLYGYLTSVPDDTYPIWYYKPLARVNEYDL